MVKARVFKTDHGKWNPVALDDNVLNSKEFEGLVGFEELYDYNTLKVNNKKPQDSVITNTTEKKKKKKKAKKKAPNEGSPSSNNAVPSADKDDKLTLKTAKKNKLTQHVRNNYASSHVALDTPSGMEAWSGLGVPNSLLHALKDKGFISPTEIQALTLPAAIFGRRDILGAAETGSGKTLAFGLPILHGILIHMDKDGIENTTEKCEGLDVHSNKDTIDETVDSEEDDEMNENRVSESESEEDDEMNENRVSESESEEDCNTSDVDFATDDSGEDGADMDDSIEGLGCVRVIDNIAPDQFPSKPSSKSKYVSKPLYGLVLTPTRELAIQVKNHILAAAKYTKINVAVVVGGMSSEKQERILNKGPSILVATPGRLWDLIQSEHPHLINVEKIRFLAIDETDRMLEKGHFAELQQLLERINIDKVQQKQRQNFVFSATLTLTHDAPRYVGKKKKDKGKFKSQRHETKLTPAQKLASIMETVGLTDPKIVDVTKSTGVAHSLTEARIICSQEEKDYYLYYFLQRHPGRTLVFCNSIGCVKRLSQLFSLLQCSPWALHASMHQKQRLKNLERFTENPRGILLATDVAARGLDIPNVQHVIHYQVPRTAESYVHRSGRTARAKQEGLTVVLMEPSESRNYARLFHNLGRDPELPSFPVEDQWLPAVKERVNMARDLDKLELRARRVTTEQGWLDKAVKEMDLELSEDELPTSMSRDESNSVKKTAASYRKRLSILVTKPLIPKGYLGKYPTQLGKLVLPFCPGGIASDEKSEADAQKPATSAVEALRRSVQDEQALKRKLNNERSKRNKKKRRKLQGSSNGQEEDEVNCADDQDEEGEDDEEEGKDGDYDSNHKDNRRLGRKSASLKGMKSKGKNKKLKHGIQKRKFGKK